MRVPNTVHASRPWRIHELTGEFRLEDVWVLPGRGGPDDLPRAVELITSYNPGQSGSFPVRTLFAIRWKLGGLARWPSMSSRTALGTAYVAAIKPFRHLLVYPPMLREYGRRWNSFAGR